MADKLVGLEASDLFNLGGNFIPQSSTDSNSVSFANMLKANGDFEKYSDPFNAFNSSLIIFFNSDFFIICSTFSKAY